MCQNQSQVCSSLPLCPGSMSLNAACAGGDLRRCGGCSCAGERPGRPWDSVSPSRRCRPPWAPGFGHAPVALVTLCFSRVDVAHLVLYHLSVCCKKKYFDFDREILPFTSENWDSLLLGEVGGVQARGQGREGIAVH